MKVFIETERLILREIEESDIQGMFQLESDPLVQKYLGNNPVKTIEEAQAIIQHIRKQYRENGIGRWAVIEKSTNEFIGWSGLKLEKNLRKEFHYYDLGYRFRKEFWGKGIATETAVESLKYGFNQMNLKEIGAAAHPENIASNKILQKVGLKLIDHFEYVGVTHNWYNLEKSTWNSL